ncbi:hypothetical protein QCA50_009134 [Cerrena zonata]|uniref:Uncharacterized protein n=1 Tax=Cerrena zonata TaxID=2478898 RepID=A0AAW0G339_9APHY
MRGSVGVASSSSDATGCNQQLILAYRPTFLCSPFPKIAPDIPASPHRHYFIAVSNRTRCDIKPRTPLRNHFLSCSHRPPTSTANPRREHTGPLFTSAKAHVPGNTLMSTIAVENQPHVLQKVTPTARPVAAFWPTYLPTVISMIVQ